MLLFGRTFCLPGFGGDLLGRPRGRRQAPAGVAGRPQEPAREAVPQTKAHSRVRSAERRAKATFRYRLVGTAIKDGKLLPL